MRGGSTKSDFEMTPIILPVAGSRHRKQVLIGGCQPFAHAGHRFGRADGLEFLFHHVAHGARAADQGGGAGGVLMAAQEHHALACGGGENLAGHRIVTGDEQGAGPVVDGRALDDRTIAANDQKPADVAILDRLLEALVHRGLRRRADQQDQVLLELRRWQGGAEAPGLQGVGEVRQRHMHGAHAQTLGIRGQQQFEQIEIAQDAAQVAVLVLHRHAADLRGQHPPIGG